MNKGSSTCPLTDFLAVESRKLSQADKSITRVYCFSKAVYEKKYLAIDALVLFYHSKMCKIEE